MHSAQIDSREGRLGVEIRSSALSRSGSEYGNSLPYAHVPPRRDSCSRRTCSCRRRGCLLGSTRSTCGVHQQPPILSYCVANAMPFQDRAAQEMQAELTRGGGSLAEWVLPRVSGAETFPAGNSVSAVRQQVSHSSVRCCARPACYGSAVALLADAMPMWRVVWCRMWHGDAMRRWCFYLR